MKIVPVFPQSGENPWQAFGVPGGQTTLERNGASETIPARAVISCRKRIFVTAT